MATPEDESEARSLILAAFAAARDSGKNDWSRMTAAVLKNRLLQLTHRQFDERALGHERFVDLVLSFPDLVQIDSTTKPATVELVAPIEASAAELEVDQPGTRIRGDLWRAIVDYTSDVQWAWDSGAGRAVDANSAEQGGPPMPTLTRGELASMQQSFASTAEDEDLDEDERSQLRRWADEGLGTSALPQQLRGRWNEVMKQEVVQRLNDFFSENSLAPPDDMLVRSQRRLHASGKDSEAARLRALVIECVRSMTLQELTALPLPAGAVLRTSQARGRRPSQHGE